MCQNIILCCIMEALSCVVKRTKLISKVSDYVVAAGNYVSPVLFNSKTQCLDSFGESLYLYAISNRLAHAGLRFQ